MTPEFELAITVHTLDSAATVIGLGLGLLRRTCCSKVPRVLLGCAPRDGHRCKNEERLKRC
jgi:hypothetical protein